MHALTFKKLSHTFSNSCFYSMWCCLLHLPGLGLDQYKRYDARVSWLLFLYFVKKIHSSKFTISPLNHWHCLIWTVSTGLIFYVVHQSLNVLWTPHQLLSFLHFVHGFSNSVYATSRQLHYLLQFSSSVYLQTNSSKFTKFALSC